MFVSTFAAVAAAEVACRVRVHRQNDGSLQVAMAKQVATGANGRVALIDIIRTNPNPRIVYELRPGLDQVPFKSAPVSTNRQGYRGREVDAGPDPDAITILGLGDSIMFGWGVGDGQEYLALVERQLQRKYPQKRWRVINLAVPAYNTVMEVETLRTKGLQFQPDLVILNLVPNDLGLPEYLRVAQDVFDLRRCFLAEFLRARLGFAREPALDSKGRDPNLRHATSEDRESADRGPYRDLAGWLPFRRALGELEELAQRHSFHVVALSTVEDEVTVRMIQAAQELGFEPVRFLPEIQKYLAEHHAGAQFSTEDPAAYLESALAVNKADGHPSALQHSMIAAKLLDSLERSGTLARLMQ